MKKTLFFLVMLSALISFSIALYSQNEDRPVSLGVYGGLNYNMHNPDFNFSIRDNLNAEHIFSFNKNKNELGFNIGGIANFPISNMFVISARLGYNSMNGKLESFINDTSQYINGKIGYFEISPILQIHEIFDNSGFYLLGGLELGIPVVKKYDYYEEPNKDYITDLVDMELLDASMRFAGVIGAGYEIPLSETVALTPEASFRMPFTKVSTNAQFDKWSIPQIRFGINLTFGLSSPPEKIVEQQSSIKVRMKEVNYYDSEGNKKPMERLNVEEIQYMELFPFLSYVFFPQDKTEPTAKDQALAMNTQTGEFNLEQLEPEAMSINRHTLDVIGRRMEEIKNAELTITGSTDGKIEKGKDGLALQRAEFVKDYLVKSFDINPMRINVKMTSSLPDKPSTSADPEGVAENRRVTLSSSNKDILAPIIIKEDVRRLANPNNIEFIPQIESTDSIKMWKLELFQGRDNLKVMSGEGNEESLSWIIFPNELSDSQAPVEYFYSAENVKGKSDQISGSIPVDYISQKRKKQEDLPDKTISKFSLVLFDFDKAEVSAEDCKILDEHVIPAIKFNSTVEIYGYTDRIGNEEYNRKLAQKRAKAVEDYLKAKIKPASFKTFAIGENNLIFNNDSPIGRQLSRTVQIRIVTPK